jgi:hypothetical protein
LELANTGRIINCDVTRQDILNAEPIFCPDTGSLKVKTVLKASDQVQSGNLVPIPATIMAHYRKVVLCVDVIKVNKMPFIVTISRAIKFRTVAWLKNEKIDTILKKIEMIDILAKASQSAMNFTNMRNELYDDNEDNEYDADSDTDSDYNSDDASSDDDDDADDDYNDLIVGVDTDNPYNSDPDAEEADEKTMTALAPARMKKRR